MSDTKEYIRFTPGITTDEGARDSDLWFIFSGGKLLARATRESVTLPRLKDIEHIAFDLHGSFYMGNLDGDRCFAVELREVPEETGNFVFSDLRFLFGIMEEELLNVSSKASELINWENSSRYCGRCGAINENKKGERSKICPACGLVKYPVISPAVIVAIVKGDKILLAHNKNFKGTMYSVVAGFVETGETFEECVKREIFEEVGIRVKNIRYFGSQPWPFPNSLMVAFTAEYEGGDIQVDNVEIGHADWFGIENLPEIPRRGSVARKLIDWFIENIGRRGKNE